jgi:hypothetical protein
MNTTMKVLVGALVLLVVGLIVYFTVFDNSSSGSSNFTDVPVGYEEALSAQPIMENFEVADANASTTSGSNQGPVYASEAGGQNELQQGVGESGGVSFGMAQLPSECYPKDVLSSADLLPRDANSLYAQVNPSTQGSLQDQNFLTAGFHIGINTIGQTLRNANRQLRSEPPNPQVKVSPWNQTTIEADINRLPLEIGGCA